MGVNQPYSVSSPEFVINHDTYRHFIKILVHLTTRLGQCHTQSGPLDGVRSTPYSPTLPRNWIIRRPLLVINNNYRPDDHETKNPKSSSSSSPGRKKKVINTRNRFRTTRDPSVAFLQKSLLFNTEYGYGLTATRDHSANLMTQKRTSVNLQLSDSGMMPRLLAARCGWGVIYGVTHLPSADFG